MLLTMLRRDVPKLPPRAMTGHLPTAALPGDLRVATAIGWRPAAALTEGDPVLTFDHGLQPLAEVIRHTGPCDDAEPALHVPPGALGQTDALILLPGTAVLIESDLAEELYGDPFVLIPQAALDGFRGIRPVAATAAGGVTLRFDRDEIVFTQPGALLLCPSVAGLLGPDSDRYQPLPVDLADAILTLMEDDAAEAVARLA